MIDSNHIPPGWTIDSGRMVAYRPCDACVGKGRICHAPCSTCDGEGWIAHRMRPVACDSCGKTVTGSGGLRTCKGCTEAVVNELEKKWTH